MLDRVYDPSPIPPDQPGNLANETTTTDTTPGQWTRGVEDVMTEKKGESPVSGSPVSGHALRLPLQTPNSTVALLSSNEAATACGSGPPEGAETPLSALGPQFQELRPHSPETLLCTEHPPCFLQDLLRAACNFCDYCPSKTLTEINAIFTFDDDGYILFDQTKWATYMDTMKEDKPPPDTSRRTKKSDVSKGASYLARKTLVLTEEFFCVRYNEAIHFTQEKLNIRNHNLRESFKEK